MKNAVQCLLVSLINRIWYIKRSTGEREIYAGINQQNEWLDQRRRTREGEEKMYRRRPTGDMK